MAATAAAAARRNDMMYPPWLRPRRAGAGPKSAAADAGRIMSPPDAFDNAPRTPQPRSRLRRETAVAIYSRGAIGTMTGFAGTGLGALGALSGFGRRAPPAPIPSPRRIRRGGSEAPAAEPPAASPATSPHNSARVPAASAGPRPARRPAAAGRLRNSRDCSYKARTAGAGAGAGCLPSPARWYGRFIGDAGRRQDTAAARVDGDAHLRARRG